METDDTVEGSAPNPDAPGGDVPDSIIELLQGTVEPESGNSESEGDPQGTEADPELTKLPDDMYKAVVSLPDELGTATVEELKDAYTASRKHEGQASALAEEQERFANDKLRYMQAIKALESKLPENATEVLEAANQAKAVYDQEQQALLEQVIPGWKDPEVKRRDAEQILELGKTYGPTTVNALAQIGDAGLMKLVYDYTKLRGRISDIQSKRRETKPKTQKSKPTVSTDAADRKRTAQALAERGDKLGAVAALLSES